MMELLERADPAAKVHSNRDRLRALVDERIGLTAPVTTGSMARYRPWMVAAATFAIVLVIAIPSLLIEGPRASFNPDSPGTSELPGVESVVPLPSGGVQTMAVDNGTIWVVTALQGELQKVSAAAGRIDDSYEIDAYVEGVVVGGGYVWLASYDNGGEILRFDPTSRSVDKKIALGGSPGFLRWFGDRLVVSNDRSELLEIDRNGEIVATRAGMLKGEGLGYLWILDPSDGSIRSMGPDGSFGEFAIPGNGPEAGDLTQVRAVGEAGGYLWLIFGDAASSVVRFDPSNGELLSLSVGRWIHSLAEHNGTLWLSSHSDHLLISVDPDTGETHRYPLPGKPGGLVVADGDLWLALYQPGQLVRMDTDADLIEASEEVATSAGGPGPDGQQVFSCTLGGVDDETIQRVELDRDFSGLGPTIILEPFEWLDYGVWSVIQAELSNEGHVVCTHGYLGDEMTTEGRAVDLDRLLTENQVPGPYLLVSVTDGVHALRLFAHGRDDIAGVVLVDPMPIGFGPFHDEVAPDAGHSPWPDLSPSISASLNDFGEVPLVVIAQDPKAMFLHEDYVAAFGAETAEAENTYWQQGIDFYASLSSNSETVTATDTAFERIIWDSPDLVVETAISMIETLP
jgi:hypothetical protein